MKFSNTIYTILVALSIVMAAAETRAGLLFTLTDRNGATNQIHGYVVNETSGALSLLPGYPASSGGNGTGAASGKLLAIDKANLRVYVLNDGSDTVSAFIVNPITGALVALPFSPITLPAGTWSTVSIHPSGSPLIVTEGDTSPSIASFAITSTSATPAPGSPLTIAVSPANSATFSRDGLFFYTSGSTASTVLGMYAVNTATGSLSFIPGGPFASGIGAPTGIASDSKGRVFTTNATSGVATAYTTLDGLLGHVSVNPFTTGMGNTPDGVMHPREIFYFVGSSSLSSVGTLQITGNDAGTTLTPVPGSTVGSGGTGTGALAINGRGVLLYALNATSRNISTFQVNDQTGVPTFASVQPANTLGATGSANSIAYLPSFAFVTNANNTGSGSLRTAVADLSDADRGGTVMFSTFFAVPRTIALTAEIDIPGHLTIAGPGADRLTVRNVGVGSRVFNIGDAANVNISGLTITGGSVSGSPGGGGILSNGTQAIVNISRCLISDNRVAGSFGGGIANAGTMIIIASTIAGNSSTSDIAGGGGIDNGGTLFVRSSTISGNSHVSGSVNNGGGIWNGGALTITSSTITDNRTNSGISGVISTPVTPRARLRNTIVAGNRLNSIRPDTAGNFITTNGGFNLIGNVGTATGLNQTGDQTGTGASPLDPKLVKVLTYKGGPTPIHMPLLNSPAVDQGSAGNHSNDQRLFARTVNIPSVPSGSGTDIGAVERRLTESIFAPPFDFDGDSRTDVGIFRPAPREWWISRSSDNLVFATQFGGAGDRIVPGDYTGDGKNDIAVWRPVNGEWLVLRSEDFSFFAFPFGANGDTPAPADYDGDSKTDAAVFRPVEATWYILRSSDGVATSEGFGSANDRVVPADYDGDGRADIAIFRPSTGEWWLNRTTAGVIAAQFGVSSDKQVPGDYTGDGKMDIAFWRPASGEWFVLRSDDFSFFSFPFGVSSDFPAPGDYDGDGKYDGAVFRPANGTFFIQATYAGFWSQQFGAAGDRPIPNAFVP